MLEEESGISPEVIEARGYYTETNPANLRALGFADYQCRPGLVMPQWTTAGVQVGYVLRPDSPRRDPKSGKPIKYETMADSRPQLDVPPGVAAALRDPAIPLDFTEGSKKADAARSRGRFCLSLNGVYGFLGGKRGGHAVIHDFDDIVLIGRVCRVIFDSDVTRKPSVRDAMERLVATLERRGAIVEVVYLPEGPDGAKVGLDDFYVAGGTNAELDALARPWSAAPPPMTPDPDDPVEVIAQLQREREEFKRTISTLVQLGMNPNLKATERAFYFAVFGLVQAKRDRGEVEPDGSVVLTPAEVSDDWRPDPEKGEHVAPFNQDGSKPRMARDKVRPLMLAASVRGLLPAHKRKVIRHRDGANFQDWEWIITPPASPDKLLAPAAGWCPDEPKIRKPRQQEQPVCPECHEVHPIRRTDTCTGCGATTTMVIVPPPEPDMSLEPTSEKLSEVKETPVVSASPAPPPRSFVRKTIGGASLPDLEPARTALASADHTESRATLDALQAQLQPIAHARGRQPVPKPGSEQDRPSVCIDCRLPLPSGHRYRCGACASVHARPSP